MKRIAIVSALLVLMVTAAAAEKKLINVNKDGVAIQGYDPVAYFTESRPVKGEAQFQSYYNGATYYFSSLANKKTFDSNPKKYEPQFGGFCAYAVSQGHTAKIEPDAFQVLNDRLLLQYDKGVREKFNKDSLGNLKKADQNWPGLVQKDGK